MNVADLLAQHGIKLGAYAPGQYHTTCPRCSARRSRAHQNTKCLGVKIDEKGACWRCNHCDWSGPEKGNAGNGKADPIEATYDYVEGGELRFQKVRYAKGREPRFLLRTRDANGGWKWGAKDVPKPLYRIDEILEAVANGHTILIAEGEKDIDNLWRIGLPATCNFDGTTDPSKNPNAKPKWKLAYSETLRGADIVILNDNDPPGYAHADTIARMSVGICQRVRRLDLAPHWPDIPKGGDVSDWLALGHTREELDALIAAAPDYAAGAPNAPPRQPSPNAVELKDMTFQPIKYVVPGVIVEGLTLLAGKPKIGKSWLLLHAAIAVARGGFTLGEIHCVEGDVLYCALEDNLRRLQSRMLKLMGATQDWPERLRFKCEMPRLGDGGLDVIKDWIASVAHPRLIIIDTLAMVRSPTKHKEQTQYDADYAAVLELRTLASEHSLAVVVVHHLRKMAAEDPFDTISGTLGLSGAPDTVLVLGYDSGGSGTIVLHGRGRDLVEIGKAMSFNREACVWTIAGDLSDARSAGARRTILDAMQEIDGPASAREIASYAGIKTINVRKMLQRLANDGSVKRLQRGKYQRVIEATEMEAEELRAKTFGGT
jgi:hypothetical protein